jgi:dihydrofolate reductase
LQGSADEEESVAKLKLDITMSLDGFVAGPNITLENPLGDGGELLHEWIVRLASWREMHGQTGGERDADNDLYRQSLERNGAVLMGRRMFSGGEGSWDDDPNRDGWWGDEPPFHVPVFILTHHERETVPKEGGTTYNFVTDGIESALDQARAAAGDKDILVAGGAHVAQQYLKAGLLDEVQLHVAPVLLGGGVRLFEGLGPEDAKLELDDVTASPAVTHLRYEVRR